MVEQRSPLVPAEAEIAKVREVGEDGQVGCPGAREVETVQVGDATQRREVDRGGGLQVERRKVGVARQRAEVAAGEGDAERLDRQASRGRQVGGGGAVEVHAAQTGGGGQRAEVDDAGGVVDVDGLEGGRDLFGDDADDLLCAAVAAGPTQGYVVGVPLVGPLLQKFQVLLEQRGEGVGDVHGPFVVVAARGDALAGQPVAGGVHVDREVVAVLAAGEADPAGLADVRCCR
ncbi:hypothetical protein [Streptomyces sp. NPDC058451]|uniref:hypothetical protein n=1 Tax=Streptomyces sp. NPDC058451 TaxID=3346506 RepID=UPI00364A99E4